MLEFGPQCWRGDRCGGWDLSTAIRDIFFLSHYLPGIKNGGCWRFPVAAGLITLPDYVIAIRERTMVCDDIIDAAILEVCNDVL